MGAHCYGNGLVLGRNELRSKLFFFRFAKPGDCL